QLSACFGYFRFRKINQSRASDVDSLREFSHSLSPHLYVEISSGAGSIHGARAGDRWRPDHWCAAKHGAGLCFSLLDVASMDAAALGIARRPTGCFATWIIHLLEP